MKDIFHFIYTRCPQTHTHHTKGYVLSVVTHAAYLFVSGNVLHNTLFISPDFPPWQAGLCACVSCVCFMCVLLRHQPGCLLVPQSKGSQPHLKQFHYAFCCVFTTACDFLNQTHMLSTEQSYSPHTKPPAGNDNLIIFGLTWPVWFLF